MRQGKRNAEDDAVVSAAPRIDTPRAVKASVVLSFFVIDSEEWYLFG